MPPTLILPAHYEALLEHFTSVDFVVWLVNPLCCIILGVVIVLAFMRANVYINEGMYSWAGVLTTNIINSKIVYLLLPDLPFTTHTTLITRGLLNDYTTDAIIRAIQLSTVKSSIEWLTLPSQEQHTQQHTDVLWWSKDSSWEQPQEKVCSKWEHANKRWDSGRLILMHGAILEAEKVVFCLLSFRIGLKLDIYYASEWLSDWIFFLLDSSKMTSRRSWLWCQMLTNSLR